MNDQQGPSLLGSIQPVFFQEFQKLLCLSNSEILHKSEKKHKKKQKAVSICPIYKYCSTYYIKEQNIAANIKLFFILK